MTTTSTTKTSNSRSSKSSTSLRSLMLTTAICAVVVSIAASPASARGGGGGFGGGGFGGGGFRGGGYSGGNFAAGRGASSGSSTAGASFAGRGYGGYGGYAGRGGPAFGPTSPPPRSSRGTIAPRFSANTPYLVGHLVPATQADSTGAGHHSYDGGLNPPPTAPTVRPGPAQGSTTQSSQSVPPAVPGTTIPGIAGPEGVQNTGYQNSPVPSWQQQLRRRCVEDCSNAPSTPTAAGAVAAGGQIVGVNQVGQTGSASSVVGSGTVYGQGIDQPGGTVFGPGIDQQNGPVFNQGSDQQDGSLTSLPGIGSGYDGVTGSNSIGTSQEGPLGSLSGLGSGLGNSYGGPGQNIPTTSGSSVTQTDNSDSGASSLLSSIWDAITGGSSGGADASAAAAGSTQTNGTSLTNLSEQNGSWVAGTTNSGASTTTTNGTTTSTVYGSDGTNYYGTVNVSGPDGNGTSSSSKYNGTTGVFSGMTVGPVTIGGGKNNTPDDNDTGGSTHPTGGLANGSAPTQKGNGDGTGNNPNGNGGASGGLASGTSLTSTTHGDGTGDSGDNTTGRTGVLASGSSLANHTQGDGGGSDSRGGSSTISTSGKVVNPGGSHNQLTGTAATAN